MLTIKNRHYPDCGTPPSIDYAGNEIGTFVSYFESESDDQWIFYSLGGRWTLYGGDIGWEDPITSEEQLAGLVVSDAVQFWIVACLIRDFKVDVASRVLQRWAAFRLSLRSCASADHC